MFLLAPGPAVDCWWRLTDIEIKLTPPHWSRTPVHWTRAAYNRNKSSSTSRIWFNSLQLITNCLCYSHPPSAVSCQIHFSFYFKEGSVSCDILTWRFDKCDDTKLSQDQILEVSSILRFYLIITSNNWTQRRALIALIWAELASRDIFVTASRGGLSPSGQWRNGRWWI